MQSPQIQFTIAGIILSSSCKFSLHIQAQALSCICSEAVVARGGTLKSTSGPSSHPAHTNPSAWKIIRDFATVPEITRPETEIRLQAHLGEKYKAEHWEPALKVVTDEEDMETILVNIDQLKKAAMQRTGLKICLPARPQQPDQLIMAEAELMQSVDELKS